MGSNYLPTFALSSTKIMIQLLCIHKYIITDFLGLEKCAPGNLRDTYNLISCSTIQLVTMNCSDTDVCLHSRKLSEEWRNMFYVSETEDDIHTDYKMGMCDHSCYGQRRAKLYSCFFIEFVEIQTCLGAPSI